MFWHLYFEVQLCGDAPEAKLFLTHLILLAQNLFKRRSYNVRHDFFGNEF